MDIRALSRQGYTYAEIGRLVGRDWRTVKRYLESGAQPVYRRRRMPSKLDPLKPLIDQWLAAEPRLQATRVHQDLVRDYGFDGSYNTVRRYVERSRPKPPRQAEERFETAPGFQAQVDWSHEQPIRTSSGLELPLYCFHMVPEHSRDSFCVLTGSQDLVTFWSCHRQAFAHFGGVPRELLYDRTKTVVRAHVGKDVTLDERRFHPEALASAHHYGFSMRLCRAYRAKTKGKVEHDVPYVREWLLRAHSFTSHEQANIAWRSWNDDVARRRVHGTHGEVVAARAGRDRSALLPLPPTGYLVVQRTTRVVARDGFFSFEGRRYHVPEAAPGERVEILLGPEELEIYSTVDGRRLARHERGRPARVLPDPVEDSVSLAKVLDALPQTEVHHRPLSVYRTRSMAELITERIRRNAAELRLHGVSDDPDELIDRAEQAKLGYREFLDLVLESEVGVLEGRRYQARLKMAGLPHHKTLDEFDVAFQPDLDPKRLAELRSLRFAEAGYLPLDRADANRIFGVVNRRYTRASTIITSNKPSANGPTPSATRHSPQRSSTASSTTPKCSPSTARATASRADSTRCDHSPFTIPTLPDPTRRPTIFDGDQPTFFDGA